MKVCIIGTGYVGLVAGACFAEFGNSVICADIDKKKIHKLDLGMIPIYEPGLEELVKKNHKSGRLVFTTYVENAICHSDIIFIAVGTPPGEDGSADLSHVLNVAKTIAENSNGFTVVVNKSTVPVGTGDKVMTILKTFGLNKDFAIVSNPEFLKEGDAINDFMKPQRVVIGTEDERALKMMKQLYAPFTRTQDRLLTMDIKSAEVTKYACNSMLATRISFMNEMANLCSKVGADISSVRAGMSYDDRIGSKFLFPGVGYGGSCFPKDVKAIISTAREHDSKLNVLQAVEKVNEEQKKILAKMVLENGDVSGKIIAIWGLAFKPQTDDVREAPAKIIADILLKEGAKLKLHDPVAIEQFKEILQPSKNIIYCENNYDAVKDSDALLLTTEWHMYRTPNFKRIKKLMKKSVIFDGRNIWNPEQVRKLGFAYYSIGRK